MSCRWWGEPDNPSSIQAASPAFLSRIARRTFTGSSCLNLSLSSRICRNDLQQLYKSAFLGQLAAQYYLSCKTMLYLDSCMAEDSSIDDLILNICHVEEYALFPVRHNEDNINRDMVVDLNLKTRMPFDSPHLKVQLMLMFYLLDKKLPNQEYVLDLKSVFDQIMRIIQFCVPIKEKVIQKGSDNLNIYSRKFNKQKEESWCLIMSDRETVICLQRFTVKRRKFLSIPFNLPTQKGTHYYSFNIMCDSYIGLDQKIELGVLIV